MTIDAADVIWCYRTFLEREPESAEVIAQHCSVDDLRKLVEIVYGSTECRQLLARKERRRLKARGVLDQAAPLTNEIYRGYRPEDRERLAALVAGPALAVDGYYVDRFGQRFDPAYHPVIADRLGQVAEVLPLPADGHLAGGIEYAAVALAFEAARGQSTFTVAELGAGFGPWVTLCGLTARRLGFQQVRLAAFEADTGRYTQLRRHLACNGLVPVDAAAQGSDGSMTWRLFNAAAWWQDGHVWWPADSDPRDAGMRAEASGYARHDYRGQAQRLTEIPALDVATALAAWPVIDLLHIDVQGSEAELVPHLLPFLSARVRSMFIGTHSRKIEGDLMALLYDNGWNLLREKPCRFNPTQGDVSLDGRTTSDGAQYWVNRRQSNSGFQTYPTPSSPHPSAP